MSISGIGKSLIYPRPRKPGRRITAPERIRLLAAVLSSPLLLMPEGFVNWKFVTVQVVASRS